MLGTLLDGFFVEGEHLCSGWIRLQVKRCSASVVGFKVDGDGRGHGGKVWRGEIRTYANDYRHMQELSLFGQVNAWEGDAISRRLK